MHIREINLKEFNEFKKNHPLNNYHQTMDYALLKSENNYEYEIIGYFNKDNEIIAAALVLVKILAGYLYAYVPEGFLIDYDDEDLMKNFTNDLIDYYKKEDIIFIKINPNVVIGEINYKLKKNEYTDNKSIIHTLHTCGYKQISHSNEFDTVLPKFNAVIDLKTTNFNKYSKNTRNKIRKAQRRGLVFEKADENKISILNKFVKAKKEMNDFYYNDYYNIFARNNNIDYFLVGLDFEKFSINAQKAYNKELLINKKLNTRVRQNPSEKNVNRKMNSDQNLLTYKNEISYAVKNINQQDNIYIAGALVIKNEKQVSILISGYDPKYRHLAPNYFLYNEIIEFYKDDFEFLSIGGISNNFLSSDKYEGLNRFKLGFNPYIYEYPGEFDLIIRPTTYSYLERKGYLEKEFNKNK